MKPLNKTLLLIALSLFALALFLPIAFAACPADCSEDGDCNDGDPSTFNICDYAASCDAVCVYIPCSTCSTDAECDDGNSRTTDTCKNPGTCGSYCTNGACEVACSTDTGCNDSDAGTIDTCSDPGTCNASCSNEVPCPVECDSDADCDDSDAGTANVCANPGECNAACSNTACTNECDSDSDCDDNDELTIDSCSNSGECLSQCSTDLISDAKLALAKPINEKYGRAETINVEVSFTGNGSVPIVGAAVRAGSGDNSVALTESTAGTYKGRYIIGASAALGSKGFTITAEKRHLGGVIEAELAFNAVIEAGDIDIVVLGPEKTTFNAGETLPIMVEALYSNGEPVSGLDLEASFNGNPLVLSETEAGIYEGSYLVLDEDVGKVVLMILGIDAHSNAGSTELELEVSGLPFGLDALTTIAIAVIVLLVAIAGFLFLFLIVLMLTSQGGKNRLKQLKIKRQELLVLKNYTEIQRSKNFLDDAQYKELMDGHLKSLDEVERSIKFLGKRHFWSASADGLRDLFGGLLFRFGFVDRARIERAERLMKKDEKEKLTDDERDIEDDIKAIKQEFYRGKISESEFSKRLFEFNAQQHILMLKKKGQQD